ncbi:MAG TPA: nucleotide exchange factor GrpE [Thermoanaerobaculia bacterium]|nr:nucleotide exchange factor GrpE [Thermoanaerobaculia bacterium]
MTDSKKPDTSSGDDDIYVIDDTGELQDVQELAGYRETPVPVEGSTGEAATGPGAAEGPGDAGLRDENQKLRDQYLRSRADFENFRKRVEREKAEYFRYALSDTLKEMLPALDNFERALGTDAAAGEDFRKGVEMIYKQLSDTLGRAGLQSIDPAGAPFDPKFHEAIARHETTEVAPHTVVDVLQKGYLLHDRLLRPAMVRVSVAPGEPDDSI